MLGDSATGVVLVLQRTEDYCQLGYGAHDPSGSARERPRAGVPERLGRVRRRPRRGPAPDAEISSDSSATAGQVAGLGQPREPERVERVAGEQAQVVVHAGEQRAARRSGAGSPRRPPRARSARSARARRRRSAADRARGRRARQRGVGSGEDVGEHVHAQQLSAEPGLCAKLTERCVLTRHADALTRSLQRRRGGLQRALDLRRRCGRATGTRPRTATAAGRRRGRASRGRTRRSGRGRSALASS